MNIMEQKILDSLATDGLLFNEKLFSSKDVSTVLMVNIYPDHRGIDWGYMKQKFAGYYDEIKRVVGDTDKMVFVTTDITPNEGYIPKTADAIVKIKMEKQMDRDVNVKIKQGGKVIREEIIKKGETETRLKQPVVMAIYYPMESECEEKVVFETAYLSMETRQLLMKE